MLELFIKKQIEHYKKIREDNTLNKNIIKKIDWAILVLDMEPETKEEYADTYKAFLLINDIIEELSNNYLIDMNSQEIAKEKMFALEWKLRNIAKSLK